MKLALLLLALILISCATPSGKIVQSEPEHLDGVVCCTFPFGNETRTCTAPEGQTCDVCAQICDTRT